MDILSQPKDPLKDRPQGGAMVFNGSDKIKEDGGDYLVLVDYLCEGFAVTYQAVTHEEALLWMIQNNHGSPQTLVKLVRIETRDADYL